MMGIFIMFLILFKNLKLSIIGVIPNFIAAFFILGIIGLLGIPLDMMTITIAAITIGIAVDNSIHYIYRFKEEFTIKIKIMNSTIRLMSLNSWCCYIKYFNYNSFWFFYISIFQTLYLLFILEYLQELQCLLAMISVLTLLPNLILIIKPFGTTIITKNV